MKVIWSFHAESSLHKIGDYIMNTFGKDAQAKFLSEMEQTAILLSKMPEIGIIEPLLRHRRHTYRSIVVGRLNKFVYYIKQDTIYIAAIWDTRREPLEQAESM